MAGERLKVVADEWPPFSGAELPSNGISMDVIATVLREAGYEVDVEILPWVRVINGAKTGEYDVVGSLFFDPEFAKFMTYGDAFYETEVKFVQRKGASHNVGTLDALRPYTIAVGDGFLYEEKFDRAEFLKKIVVTTTLQALQMVAHERADLTLDSEEVVRHSLRFGAPDILERVEIIEDALASHEIHMAVRKDHPKSTEIVADFNRTLSKMRSDGSLNNILVKHLTK